LRKPEFRSRNLGSINNNLEDEDLKAKKHTKVVEISRDNLKSLIYSDPKPASLFEYERLLKAVAIYFLLYLSTRI
jgi:hypothetical protein